MLAYLFWHRPQAAAERPAYEAALTRFHQALAETAPPGLVGSAAYRIGAVPWLGDREGYEDWHLVEGTWALDPLNSAAAAGRMTAPHGAVAGAMAEGHGGLYRLVGGEPGLPPDARALWLTRPRGIDWRPVIDTLLRSAPAAACWRRQMVLGPAAEFAVIVPSGEALPVPEGWTARTVERVRLG